MNADDTVSVCVSVCVSLTSDSSETIKVIIIKLGTVTTKQVKSKLATTVENFYMTYVESIYMA